MNAVREFASALQRRALVRMVRTLRGPDCELPRGRSGALAHVAAAFELGLAAFLNHANRSELEQMAVAIEVDAAGSIGALRARLWLAGAEREARGEAQLGTPWQPLPVVLGGKLVYMRSLGGLAPPTDEYPRALP